MKTSTTSSTSRLAKQIIRKGSRITGTGITRFIMSGLKTSFPRNERSKLYCGDAAYCSRKSMLFATTKGENKTDAASLLYMDIGTAIHRNFQKGLNNAGILVEAERKINLEQLGITLTGMVDGILLIDEEHKILEIKTCGALPPRPKKEHLHQALTYALITGIYKVIIFYQSRKVAGYDGRLECVEFEIDVTPIQLDMVAEILATSFVCTKRKIVPPIPLHIASQGDCGFCPFTTTCWGPDAKRITKLKSSVEDEIEQVKLSLLKMSKKAHKEYA